MSDPIDRQAAIDVIHHTIYEFFDVVEDDDESPLTYKDKKLLELNKSISTRVKDLPTADVVERKAGEWTERKVIEDGKAIEEWQSARCSVCGKYHTTPYLYYFDDFAYCPSCGARMKGESDG